MAERWHGMVCRQPAVRWQEAMPVGNGSVGALVYGHIRNELILVNHEALWLRSPRPELPDVSSHLPKLRATLAAGEYQDAAKFIGDKLAAAGYEMKIDPYHPAFDVRLDMATHAAFEGYRRGVDFETATAWVMWREAGVDVRRDVFVSRADDVLVIR